MLSVDHAFASDAGPVIQNRTLAAAEPATFFSSPVVSVMWGIALPGRARDQIAIAHNCARRIRLLFSAKIDLLLICLPDLNLAGPY